MAGWVALRVVRRRRGGGKGMLVRWLGGWLDCWLGGWLGSWWW